MANKDKKSTNKTKKEKEYIPKKGGLTYLSEGNRNPKSDYYTGRPHLPGGASGVTIGHGYDCKEITSKEICKDMQEADLSKEQAEKMSKASGLQGQAAKNFCNDHKNIDLTSLQDVNLFNKTYPKYEKIAEEVLKKNGVK
jgi:hypothetical protein